MDAGLISLVAVFFFTLAALYAYVGHGGASGYSAVTALVVVGMKFILT